MRENDPAERTREEQKQILRSSGRRKMETEKCSSKMSTGDRIVFGKGGASGSHILAGGTEKKDGQSK